MPSIIFNGIFNAHADLNSGCDEYDNYDLQRNAPSANAKYPIKYRTLLYKNNCIVSETTGRFFIYRERIIA